MSLLIRVSLPTLVERARCAPDGGTAGAAPTALSGPARIAF
jgi:hypothetical protein